MAEPQSSEISAEQRQLLEQLVAEYGNRIVVQARELSGLALCLVSMSRDDLNPLERADMYRLASIHLAALLETVMPAAVSAKVNECAQRLDSAIDVWVADGIEARDGLPAGVPPLWPK